MVATRIKVYAERNTGSRYLTKILRHNLNAVLLSGVAPRWATWMQNLLPGKEVVRDTYFDRTFARNYGWKHSLVRTDWLLELGQELDDVHFVALIKNPYSWLLSLARRPYHLRAKSTDGTSGVKQLLSSPWPAVVRDNGPLEFRDAVDLWNQKVSSYRELARCLPTTFVKYEELVATPEKAVEKIRLATGDVWKQGSFKNLSESTKEKGKDSSFYRNYYGDEVWKAELTPDVIAMINERLSSELMSEFGYELL